MEAISKLPSSQENGKFFLKAVPLQGFPVSGLAMLRESQHSIEEKTETQSHYTLCPGPPHLEVEEGCEPRQTDPRASVLGEIFKNSFTEGLFRAFDQLTHSVNGGYKMWRSSDF